MSIPKEQNKALIENGTYRATLTNVYRFSNSFGQRIGFEFTLYGRNVEGETIKALTRRNEPALQSLESLIGARCIVLIVQQRNRQGKVFNSVDRIFCSMKLT